MRIWKNEAGQVLVLTALSMTLMLGFAGLAVDVGMLFHVKRNLQIAADAAALAGAIDYKYNASSSSAVAAAQAAATENGITDLSDLTVSTPPADGPNKGSTGFVEAIVAQPNPTWFMSLFGVNSVDVTARAVAGNGGPGTACIYVLDPSADQAMYMGGKFVVSAPGCGVVVNSNNACALYFNGTSGSLTAAWVSVTGGDCKQTSDSNPAPVTSAAPVSDPLLGKVTWPTLADCGATDSSTTTISAATATNYTPAASIVCFQNTVTFSGPAMGTSTTNPCPSYLTLGSAIYVFEQGVVFNGGCIQSGSDGTTFDLYGNFKQGSTYYSADVSTQTYFNLFAPTNPKTEDTNIVMMQPSGNSTGVIDINQGTSVGTISGIIYAPTGQLQLTDQGATSNSAFSLTLNADLIVGTFDDQASDIQVNSYSTVNPNQSMLTRVTLVE